jgi:hypothetical protein
MRGAVSASAEATVKTPLAKPQDELPEGELVLRLKLTDSDDRLVDGDSHAAVAKRPADGPLLPELRFRPAATCSMAS